MSEQETGLKWWLRYIIVPLIGGGGIVTLLIALMERPVTVPKPTAAISVQDETVKFFVYEKVFDGTSSRRVPATPLFGNIHANVGDVLEFEWEVPYQPEHLVFVEKEGDYVKTRESVSAKGYRATSVEKDETVSLEDAKGIITSVFISTKPRHGTIPGTLR